MQMNVSSQIIVVSFILVIALQLYFGKNPSDRFPVVAEVTIK